MTVNHPMRNGTPTDFQSNMSTNLGANVYSGLKPNFFNMDIN